MTGHAGNGGDHRPFVVLVEAEIFFIDLAGHAEHAAGDIFFRFGVAGEIHPM